MKTLRNLLLTLFICGLLFIPVSVASAFDGGSGTEVDPYLISTADQLNEARKDLSAHYKLVNDINLSSYDNWEPIGNSTSKFAGSLDGNNHKITNLKINRPGTHYQGLFGYTNSTAKISDLGLEDVDVSGSNFTGGLVAWNDGNLINCYSTGNITGTAYVGGLVGHNRGTITNCYSTGSVTGADNCIGGLVGDNRGTITNCYSTGSVTGSSYTGGLVGLNYNGTMENCYSTGSVTGAGSNTGGLVGLNYTNGIIENCYWDINTSSQTTSAGGTGKTTIQMKQQTTFAGWAFPNTWSIEETKTYPWLTNLPKPEMPEFGYIPVTGVTLNLTEITLNLEETKTETLTATVSPEDALNKNITWTSSNEAVATVDNTGTVTAISVGTATITVTTVDGGHTDTCTVTVEGGFNPTVTANTDKKYYSGKEGYNTITVTGEVSNLKTGDNITVTAELIKQGEETGIVKTQTATADENGTVSLEHQFRVVEDSITEGKYNIEVTVTKQ